MAVVVGCCGCCCCCSSSRLIVIYLLRFIAQTFCLNCLSRSNIPFLMPRQVSSNVMSTVDPISKSIIIKLALCILHHHYDFE
jgi:hypothetical protein